MFTNGNKWKNIYALMGSLYFIIFFPIIVDGACLFRSLSFVMYGTDLMSKKVRELIVRHVVEN